MGLSRSWTLYEIRTLTICPQGKYAAICRFQLLHNPAAVYGDDDKLEVLLKHLAGLAFGVEQMAAYDAENRLTLKYEKVTKHILKANAVFNSLHTLDTLGEMQFHELHRTTLSVPMQYRSSCFRGTERTIQ